MFDWNDEELANILWGEAGDGDDHIVPYSEESENHCNKEPQKEAYCIKVDDQKKPGTKSEIHGRKESSSDLDNKEGNSSSGFAIDAWAELSLSKDSKTDRNSMGTNVSDKLTEIRRYDSSKETTHLDKDAEIYQTTQEGKEQGDFVDYGWDNIGSFDDLDRIFSDDDPVFGHTSLGNSDELWSSSKDVTKSPVKSFPTSADSPSVDSGRTAPELLDHKTEYMQQHSHSFSLDYGKMNDPASHSLHGANEILENIDYAGGTSRPQVNQRVDTVGKSTAPHRLMVDNVGTANLLDEIGRRNKLLKYRKKLEEKKEGKILQGYHGNWYSSTNPPGQFENQLALTASRSSHSSVHVPHGQIQGHEFLKYQQISNPFMHHSSYQSLSNPYPMMPLLSQIHPGELQHQPPLSPFDISHNVSHTRKSVDNMMKPLTMTPQEKLEKLRRRQQMQAMLAIQKQHQQLSQQVPCTSPSISQKCSQEIQIQNFEKADPVAEIMSTFPAIETNSSSEQDDSNTVSVRVDGCAVEDTILYRLQETIAKLDMKVRFCIRNSMFRLAQSARQRHFASDTGSINKVRKDKLEVLAKGELDGRSGDAGMPEVETETNPIDRTVAHLLFHQPSILSGKHPDGPESPISQVSYDSKTPGSVNLPIGSFSQSSKRKLTFPQQGSGTSCSRAELQHVDQLKASPCKDTTSKNASNNGPADGTVLEFEPFNEERCIS